MSNKYADTHAASSAKIIFDFTESFILQKFHLLVLLRGIIQDEVRGGTFCLVTKQVRIW